MKKVLLHFGLPKTATTSLQSLVFNGLKNEGIINFIGKFEGLKDVPAYNFMEEINNHIILDDDDKFAKNLKLYKSKIDDLLEENKLNVISEENLSISFKSKKLLFEYNLLRNIQRLGVLFHEYDVKFLISIRRQPEIIHSFYVEFFKHQQLFDDIENNTLKKYINNGIKDQFKGNLAMFFYDRIVEELLLISNKDFIKIIIYEDLVKGNDIFFKTLSDLLSVPEYKIKTLIKKKYTNTKTKNAEGYEISLSLSQLLKKILYPLLVNKFFRSIIKSRYLTKFFCIMDSFFKTIKINNKTINYLTEDEVKTLTKTFSSSNKNLDTLFNLDLGSHGYYVE